jgi:hypothetical protein
MIDSPGKLNIGILDVQNESWEKGEDALDLAKISC